MTNTKIKLAAGMGRGIFASHPIKSRCIVLTCHTWILTEKDVNQLSKTSITGNYFSNPFNDDECLLALGDLSLINHSNDPNVYVNFINTKTGIVVKAIANRNIKTGEQLFIDYGPSYSFEV